VQEHRGAVRTEPAVVAWLAPHCSSIKAGGMAMLVGSMTLALRPPVTNDTARRPATGVLRHHRIRAVRSVVAIIGEVLCLGLLAGGLAPPAATAAEDAAQLSNPNRSLDAHDDAATVFTIERQPVEADVPKRAIFDLERASSAARKTADWVVDSGDNRNLPFAIVDKADAKVFVFDPGGRLRGAAPALLGMAPGDASVPGIGTRAMSLIRPEERTTPSGRFVATLGRNLRGKEILWVDYDNAISLHPVVKGTPKERRAERLASPTPLDNRISYGCINVPATFFENIVRPAFSGTHGIVYVLPETT
jgi:hypothetical protein